MSSFWQQLKALIWRNILLKRRNKAQLLQELLFPVYFVGILAMIRGITKPETKPARQYPVNNLEDTSFFSGNLILVVPNTTQVDEWMKDVVGQLPRLPKYQLLPTVEASEALYISNSSDVLAGIIFNFSGDPWSYALRMRYDTVPGAGEFNYNIGQCIDAKYVTPLCPSDMYLSTGFALLQKAIENVLVKNITQQNVTQSRKIQVQMMDTAEFSPDATPIQTISPIYFVFSFAILANFLAVSIVAEKEKKIKDGMLMMGLRSSVFWLSWSLVYFTLVLFASVLMIIIITVSQYFKQSNMFLLFLCFLLYGCSIISFAFMITPFFNKSKVAGAVTGFSTVIISCIYLAISLTRNPDSYDVKVPVGIEWLLCLLSPLSFASFIDQAIFLDIHKNGFGFDGSLTYGKFPLYAPIIMLVVDIILYSVLTVYFDNVIPGEYGVKKQPLYFLKASYWFPQQPNTETSRLTDTSHNMSQSADVETVHRDMDGKIALRISSLTKSFPMDGKLHKAVDGFCLDIYEGQITCLLGHNGAGKTTLINMLTGVIPPTSGSANIMGLDITDSSDLEQIRRQCGICPQHNILYDVLSCREHLEMFAKIKGVPPHLINRTVEQALSDVDLTSQSETFAKDLSGGQKRKLSVAIALIGDPKLIFLDEPTAGMDPFSRRHLWSLLKRMKEGKVVLLTTHFMDEADILADRKAFIRKGKLRCCGSSLFLKNKFGIGYHLTMVVSPACDVGKVTNLLQSVIPDIEHKRSHGKEISFTVPLRDVSKFSDLFTTLDKRAEELGIRSYGVSMTTLEEVFLKLEADELVDNEDENFGEMNVGFGTDVASGLDDMSTPLPMVDSVGKATVRGSDLTKQRLRSLMRIRFLLMLRDVKAVLFQIILPVALVIFGLLISKLTESSQPEKPNPLSLTSSMYVTPVGSADVAGKTKPLLVFDDVNNTESQALISDWKSLYTVDSFAVRPKNISSVAPHNLGICIQNLTGQFLSNFSVMYNGTAVHSIPVTINMATQSIIDSLKLPGNITANSLPWPPLQQTLNYNAGAMFSAMLVGLAYLLIMPGFAADIVRDREWKLRSQLRISGVTFNIYWGAIYICDFLVYLIPSIMIIIVIIAMQIKGLSSGAAVGAVILLLVTNIPFNIVLALVLSFLFDKADTCTAYLPILLELIALIPYMIVSLIDMISHSQAAIILHYVACIADPPYMIFGGFYFINRVGMVSLISGREADSSDYFQFENHVIIAFIMPVIHLMWMYWLLRVLDVKKAGGNIIEAFPFLSKSVTSVPAENTDIIDNEDEDVKAERFRIERLNDSEPTQDINGSNEQPQPVAYMSQLRKVYVKRTKSEGLCRPGQSKSKVAVRNLSIGVQPGEVLGLLGPNGAGKTTALNMMIAETGPTCGKVVISGHNIRTNLLSVLESLGYCPQHDALWENITLEEHIRCFAAIKGVASIEIDRVVDHFVKHLKLEEHKKKHAKKLSGGTKRKLSYILSILGSPSFVLMDEPSTGMDPQSKRFLWDTISSSFSNTERGAVLTTHYMEEADALCGRVGIMINGQLECLGPTQHLKSKFGSGYILEIKLKSHQMTEVESLMNNLESHLKQLFPGLETVERFQERAQYSIPKEVVRSLGETFSSLEQCKQTHGLEEYSFSQSSLEQVFLQFARKQLEEEEDETSRNKHVRTDWSLSNRVRADV